MNWKKYLRISFWLGLFLCTIVLTGFINHNLSNEKCKEVIINIEDENHLEFINEGDILDLLNKEFHTPISQKIGEINTFEIEKRLNNHQAVEDAQVYISIDRSLWINIKQRCPVVRVFSGKYSFYIDDNGEIMPTSPKYTSRVPIASGHIGLNPNQIVGLEKSSEEIPKLYDDLLKLSLFIQKDPLWKAQIEQLYVNKDSEFELIPRVGNHTIVLGEVNDLERKFEKLKLFYSLGLSKTGWNEYKTINLKFKNQVVCTKRY